MSDKPTTAPLDKTIEAPAVSGITTKAREARAAEERAPSAATLSIMPGVGDLARELGIRMPGTTAKTVAAANEEETEEDAEAGEGEEEEGGDGEAEEEEESAGDGTETEDEEEGTEEEGTEEEGTEEEGEEGEGAEEEELPPEAVKIRDSMQKRIDKLTARNATVEQQLQDAQVKNAKFEREFGPAPTPEQPLADVHSEGELQQRINEARAVKNWALRNRNGGEIPGKDGADPVFYDADQVAEALANAEQVIDAAPQRAAWIAEAASAEAKGKAEAPMFYKEGSDSKKTIDAVMSQVPASVKAWRPDIKLILIQALVGSHFLSQAAAAAKPGGKPGAKPAVVSVKKAPAAPTGRQAPKTTSKVIQQRKNAQTLKKSSGSVRDLAAVLGDRLGF